MYEKLKLAISALNDIRTSIHPRLAIDINLTFKYISPDDPWVAAALGCVNDADVPDVALEFFLADVKAGYYDMHNPEPLATP